MSPLYLHNGKILTVGGALAISADCCCNPCCCDYLNLSNLKELFGGGFTRAPTFGNPVRPPCPNPETWDQQFGPLCNEELVEQGEPCRPYQEPCDWHLKEACLRWVCRCLDDNLNIICEQVYGGPSITNKDLIQLVLDAKGLETEPGCYVYTIEFFGWHDREGTGGWISSDDLYSVNKTKLDGACDGIY